MKNCLICDNPLTPFLDLGPQPIANGFLKEEQFKDEYFFNLEVAFCPSCNMVQLLEQPDREQMFHENYAFFSSTSKHMQEHFKTYAQKHIQERNLGQDSFVVEVGCNDGILIKNFAINEIPHLGIEPSKNVADAARENGVNVKNCFFDKDVAQEIESAQGKADLILSANVMCHIPYMHSIFSGIKVLLKDKGVFAFEDPYLGDIVTKTSFDQIYDEHVFFFSLHSVAHLASLHDLELVDIEPLETHGGSMRYYIAHKGSQPVSEAIAKQMEAEKDMGLDKLETMQQFARKVDAIRHDFKALLSDLKKQGKKIVGYGATSKSTTMINYAKILPEEIDFISDTTPLKQGKCSPGMHIPIAPYENFRDSKPDYVVLFAWNHAKEIMEKENEFMQEIGAKWIMYVPKVEIINHG